MKQVRGPLLQEIWTFFYKTPNDEWVRLHCWNLLVPKTMLDSSNSFDNCKLETNLKVYCIQNFSLRRENYIEKEV